MQICADTTFEDVHFSLGSRESRDGDDLLCTFTSIHGKNAEDSKNEEDDTIREVRDSADVKRFDNENDSVMPSEVDDSIGLSCL